MLLKVVKDMETFEVPCNTDCATESWYNMILELENAR